MAKYRRGCYIMGLIGAAIVGYVILFGSYTRTETFWLTYFPDNSFPPASNLPNVDGQGQPKVVMVRGSGQIECFEVFYSHELKKLMEASPSRRAAVTYQVKYRLQSFLD